MTHKQQLKELTKIFGEENTKEIIRLTTNFDKYLLKFKIQMNEILKSAGYEVKTGFVVQPISEKKE